jgi:hypothetical protein
MFPLLETAIGFVAVMLTLSLLVKSLTSLIKDHFDFYSDNIRYEINCLFCDTIGQTFDDLRQDPTAVQRAPFLANTDWRRVGDEFFNRQNVEWMLTRLGAAPADLQDLDGRLTYYLGRAKYAFDTRMKTLSLAAGLALCLLLDVNAVRIWHTLYTNSQLRTFFESEYATQALLAAGNQSAPQPESAPNPQTAADLAAARAAFAQSVTNFVSDVSFGVGRIWQKGGSGGQPSEAIDTLPKFLAELLGALFTGLLVSVGAPYWHDLLKSLSALRRPGK